jgi:hypothetical protein
MPAFSRVAPSVYVDVLGLTLNNIDDPPVRDIATPNALRK